MFLLADFRIQILKKVADTGADNVQETGTNTRRYTLLSPRYTSISSYQFWKEE